MLEQPEPTASAPLLDFERLDVYRLALEFQALVSSIALPQGRRELPCTCMPGRHRTDPPRATRPGAATRLPAPTLSR